LAKRWSGKRYQHITGIVRELNDIVENHARNKLTFSLVKDDGKKRKKEKKSIEQSNS
jgi:hypothetical protein